MALGLILAIVFFLAAILSPSRALTGKDVVECLAFALVAAVLVVRLVGS